MNYLVADASAKIRDSLCYVLLSFGIKGFPVDSRPTALKTARENELEGAIIDLDSKELEGSELIKELRESESTQSIKIIAHTIQSSKDLVAKMIEFGVVGYLLKPFDEDNTYDKLKKILEKSQQHNTQRKHIRVRPDPEELLRLSFRVAGQKGLISGKVVDISVGGVAIELFNPPQDGILIQGTRLSRLQFTLSSRQFSTYGVVILSKGKFLALRFDGLNAADKTAIARYVFKRIAS